MKSKAKPVFAVSMVYVTPFFSASTVIFQFSNNTLLFGFISSCKCSNYCITSLKCKLFEDLYSLEEK